MKILNEIFKDFELRKYKSRTSKIKNIKNELNNLEDREITNRFNQIKNMCNNSIDSRKNIESIENEVLGIASIVFNRVLNIDLFDVQFIGSMIMNDGHIAELKTGEGKTYVAVLLAIINNAKNEQTHIVTANEYLAKRDFQETKKVFDFLDIKSSYVVSSMTKNEKLYNYQKDVVYVYAQELGFDYLRSNLVLDKDEKCISVDNMKNVIIDEIDYVLIDEAKTPIVLSTKGDIGDSTEIYIEVNTFIESIKNDTNMYTVDIENDVATLTESGIEYLEKYFNIKNYSDISFIEKRHAIHQAMYAHFRMTKNDSYIVDDEKIVLVDMSTGRLSRSKVFSDGLHQALQAKENLTITPQNKILGKITYSNLFKLYKKMTGMSGTVKTDELEFAKNFNKHTIVVPTNKAVQRIDKADFIFATKEQKINAIVKSIQDSHRIGQPVLIGTDSIATSEYISGKLKDIGINHNILNAKNHEMESQIISTAGEKYSVTVSTNMAGRGTDIKLTDESRESGGLKVIGTYRNDNRRIDNQLRGRAGRQGDVGVSEFYVSLEDDLVKGFAPAELRNIMERHQNNAESEGKSFTTLNILSKQIEKAQIKKEGSNFESRLYNYQFDNILNNQRLIIYNERDKALDVEDVNLLLVDIVSEAENLIFDRYVNPINKDSLSKEDILSIVNDINNDWDYNINIEKKDMSKKELSDNIKCEFKKVYTPSTESIFGKENNEYKRICILYNIDKYWAKHLCDLKNLEILIKFKENPLYEYEKDSLELFNSIIDEIKIATVFSYLRNLKKSKEEECKNE